MITDKRIEKTLDWMVTSFKHQTDTSDMNTGYSRNLQEAIDLLDELKNNNDYMFINLGNIPGFAEERLTKDDVYTIIMDALKMV